MLKLVGFKRIPDDQKMEHIFTDRQHPQFGPEWLCPGYLGCHPASILQITPKARPGRFIVDRAAPLYHVQVAFAVLL